MPAILELSVMPNRNKAHTRRMGGISPFSFSWMCADSVSCWFSSFTKVGYRDRNALSNSVRNSLFSFSVLVEEERRLRSSLLWLAFIFLIAKVRSLHLSSPRRLWPASLSWSWTLLQVVDSQLAFLHNKMQNFELLKTYLAVSLWTQCFGKNKT